MALLAKSVSLRLLSKPAAAAPSATIDPPIETPTPMVTENKSMSVDENEGDERPTEIWQILDELADRVEDTLKNKKPFLSVACGV